MAAERPYGGSNAARILEVITTETKIEQKIGSAEDARRSAPPRVIWVPAQATYKDPVAAQRADMKVALDRLRAFKVHFHGKDFEEAERLQDLVLGALFNRFSPYAETAGPEDAPFPEDAEHKAFTLVQTITLRYPVPAELRQRVTLVGGTAHGSATNPAGDSSPAPTITVP